jgi:NAD(P)H-hydrate repair Nnr-like enzyme with NAD(P)H-hydrate epimerase domain
LPKDAAAAYKRFIDDGGSVLDSIPSGQRWALIVDGLFGIGLQRPISGFHGELVLAANALAVRDRCPCSPSTVRVVLTPIPATLRRDDSRQSHHHLHRRQARLAYG